MSRKRNSVSMKRTSKNKMSELLRHVRNSFRRINSQIRTSTILSFRSRLTFFFFFALPVFLLLLFGSIFVKQQSFQYDLVIQNHDGSSVSLELEQKLEENSFLSISHLNDLTIDPKEYMRQNQIHACLVIPPNWFEDSILFDSSNILLIVNPYMSSYERIIRIVGDVINEFNLERNNTTPLVNLETEVFYSENINYIDFFLPGIIGVVIMNVALTGTIMRQVHYKKIGIFKKFATTPLTHFEYQMSELILHFVISLLASFICIIIAWLFFGFSLILVNAMLFPIIFIGVLLFTGLGLVLSLIIKNPNNSLFVSLGVIVPMMILSGVFFDVSSIKTLAILSKFSPLSYIINALRASLISTNYRSAWINLSIALSLGIVALIVGNLLSRWERE